MKSFLHLKSTHTQVIVALIACASSMSSSYAGVTIPNTFTTGTAAVASQVNDNFTALASQMPGIEWAAISATGIDVSTRGNDNCKRADIRLYCGSL